MLFDLIALGILVVFIALGAMRGTLAGFLRVTTLASAYAAGIFGAAHLGVLVSVLTGSSRLIATALAGGACFLLVFFVLSVLSAIAIRFERQRRDDIPRGGLDRTGGALFGALQACLALLLLGVLGSFLDAAHKAGLPQGTDAAANSYLVGSAQKVMAAGVDAAMGGSPGGKLAVRLASDPGAALGTTQRLLQHPRVGALFGDQLFWQYLSTGETDLALGRSTFFAVIHDDELRGELADLGVVDEDARTSPEAFRTQMAHTFTEIAPRLRALREDPALAELAAKPEIQAAIESGDAMALLAHPDFRRLVDRALKSYEKSSEQNREAGDGRGERDQQGAATH
jgi:uncharacterized membrane protein required for colicin V production